MKFSTILPLLAAVGYTLAAPLDPELNVNALEARTAEPAAKACPDYVYQCDEGKVNCGPCGFDCCSSTSTKLPIILPRSVVPPWQWGIPPSSNKLDVTAPAPIDTTLSARSAMMLPPPPKISGNPVVVDSEKYSADVVERQLSQTLAPRSAMMLPPPPKISSTPIVVDSEKYSLDIVERQLSPERFTTFTPSPTVIQPPTTTNPIINPQGPIPEVPPEGSGQEPVTRPIQSVTPVPFQSQTSGAVLRSEESSVQQPVTRPIQSITPVPFQSQTPGAVLRDAEGSVPEVTAGPSVVQ